MYLYNINVTKKVFQKIYKYFNKIGVVARLAPCRSEWVKTTTFSDKIFDFPDVFYTLTQKYMKNRRKYKVLPKSKPRKVTPPKTTT